MAGWFGPRVILGVRTAICMLAMFNAGLNLGGIGPLLPDFQYHTGTTTQEISTLLVWSGIGCAVGALGGGPLFDRFDGLLCLTMVLFFEGVFAALTPLCPDLVGVSTTLTLTAVCNYALFSGTFALTLKYWRAHPSMTVPIVQSVDTLYAFGTALAPLISQPFLGDYRNITQNTENPDTGNSSFPREMPDDIENNFFLGFGWNFQTICIIVAIFNVALSLVCFGGYLFEKQIKAEETLEKRGLLANVGPEVIGFDNKDLAGQIQRHHLLHNRKSFIFLLVNGFLFFLINGGRDVIITGLLYTYLTEFLDFSPEEATLLLFVYHMIRTIGHIVVAIISKWVSPLLLGISDLIILVVTSVGLAFTYDLAKTSVWVCIGVMGLATCNIYPTSLSLVEEAVPVSGKISGLLFCGMASGQIVFALIGGSLLQIMGARGVPVTLVVAAISCVLLYIPLAVVVRRLSRTSSDCLIIESNVDNTEVSEKTPLLGNEKHDSSMSTYQ